MAANSKIEWTTHTFNPWIGCAKVHAGCTNCYAEADMDKRRGRVKWGAAGTRSKTSESYWKNPLRWDLQAKTEELVFDLMSRIGPFPACAMDIFNNSDLSFKGAQKALDGLEKRGLIAGNKGNLGGYLRVATRYQRPRVFCASLADVFEDWQGPIQDHRGETLAINKNGHVWPWGWPSLSDGDDWGARDLTIEDLREELFDLIDRTPNLDWMLLTKRPENIQKMWEEKSHAAHWETPCDSEHRKNVWLLTSVSDQETAERMITELLRCRNLAPVLGISAEPLLGPIDLTGWFSDIPECTFDSGLDLVIAGHESGPNRRPGNISDIRSLCQQCSDAGVAFFNKQMQIGDRLSHDMDEWPEDLRVRQMPFQVS